MKQTLLAFGVFFSTFIYAQNVGVGTTSPSAKLDINSNSSGVLIPRIALTSTTVAAPVSSPITSMLVYNTATAGTGTTAVTPGFYYWDGTGLVWTRLLDNVAASNNIYNTDGTLTGARTITMGANNLTLTAGNGNLRYSPTGSGNVAMGSSLTATGTNSFATGIANVVSGNYAFVTGANNNAAGNYSAVSGLANKDNGVDDVVGGTNNYVTAGYGHSIVVGNNDTVAGSAGAVFGFLNKISAFEAFAQGDRNTASGAGSAVFGGSNIAAGDLSFVTGQGNVAPSFSEMAIGTYGTTYTAASTSSINATDRLFNIGNGTGTGTRADAFTILKNGNVGIGNAVPGQKLDVNGVINAATGFKVAGGTPGTNTYLKGNGTNFVAGSILAGDVPTLNQNTTGSAASFTGNLVGDVTGTQGATTLSKIQGTTVSISSLTTGNLLQYNGTNWTNVTPASLATNNIYNTDGALTTARTVTMGANNLSLNSTTGNLIFNPSTTGGMSIGNTNPASNLLNVSTSSIPASGVNGSGLNLAAQIGGTNASGGAVNISAGQGGNPAGGFPAGGSVSITAGAGGTGGSSGTTGGNVTIAANGSSFCASCGLTGGSVNIYSGGPISGSSITPGNINFYTGFATPTQVMTIYGTNNNVGIGTSTPGQKLEVNGNIKVSGNFMYLSTGGGAYYADVNNTVVNTPTNGSFYMANVGIDGTRVAQADGSLRVGGPNQPTASLTVNGTTKLGSPGTAIKSMQVGQVNVNSSGSSTNADYAYTLTFPNTFANIPKVIATPQTQTGQTYSDNFSIIIQSVTTSTCVIRIRRTDSSSNYSQQLLVNWFAFDN